MKNQILFIVLFLASWLLYPRVYSQITRGAQPSEIYISNDWYFDGYIMHRAVFRSADNGEHVSVQYTSTNPPQAGDMMIGSLIGDATPGVLYNGSLWVSFDYGVNWGNVQNFSPSGSFTSGCIEGELFRCCANVQGTIWRSIDYGNEFVEITQDAKYVLEVGVIEGNIYGRDGNAGIGYNLYFSTNYGEEFVTIPIDSAVAFWAPGGQYPKISRGTEPGELYLVSWWPDYHYKIFHSVDTGYTWTEKYESDFINIYYWGVQYTAGREPGSFYVMRSRGDPTNMHLWLFIDYSSDYGQTFTTYFHDMDSTFTAIKSIEPKNIKLSNYPNPFTDITTIRFELPRNNKNSVLNIYNIHGKLIRQYNITGKKLQQWDGTNSSGNKVNGGIYFYSLIVNNKIISTKKLIFVQ